MGEQTDNRLWWERDDLHVFGTGGATNPGLPKAAMARRKEAQEKRRGADVYVPAAELAAMEPGPMRELLELMGVTNPTDWDMIDMPGLGSGPTFYLDASSLARMAADDPDYWAELLKLLGADDD
jgi:hypothetical protein